MVMAFLNQLSEKLRPQAEADFHIMTKMKQSDLGGSSVLAAWDTPYYTGRYKKQWLNASSSEFAPYFSLGACMEGVSTVMNALYGVHFEYADMEPGESWSQDIYKIQVIHETEGLLGHIYCDFYDRHGKPNQACHFTVRGGREMSDGSYQVCSSNFSFSNLNQFNSVYFLFFLESNCSCYAKFECSTLVRSNTINTTNG